VRISYARGGVLRVPHHSRGNQEGSSQSRKNQTMGGPAYCKASPWVPRIRELLSTVHQGIFHYRPSPFQSPQEGRPLRLESRLSKFFRPTQTSIHHGTHPPTFQTRSRHSHRDGRLRLRSRGGTPPTTRRRELPPNRFRLAHDVAGRAQLRHPQQGNAGVIFACREWRSMLLSLDKPFQSFVNHKSLEYFLSKPPRSSLVDRNRLSTGNFELVGGPPLTSRRRVSSGG
jgi:hypothetical protein